MKKLLMGLAILSLALLGACSVTATYTGPLGDVEFEGKLDPRSGQPADSEGQSLGRGKVVFEDGTEIDGEFFDSTGDGKPDKFKPDAGQDGGHGYGSTDGETWYDITPQ